MDEDGTGVPRRVVVRGAIAVVLLLAGLLCLAAWRLVSGSTDAAFAQGGGTPPAAHVTEGDTYSLAVPGGVRALIANGVYAPPDQGLDLSCDWTTGNAPEQGLAVSGESASTKAETTVARFYAPITGDIRVTCANWGAMFVPDADDVAFDTSGLFLVLSIVTLTLGVGLGLSAARSLSLAGSGRRAGEDDEIEGFVDVGAGDGEVGDPDPRDGPA